MHILKKFFSAIHSRTGAYLFALLSAFAYSFFKGAQWTYGWITQLYPMGSRFISLMFWLTATVSVVHLVYLFFSAVAGEEKDRIKCVKIINILHTVFSVISVALFVYTFILVFGIDSGVSTSKFIKGLNAITPYIMFPALTGSTGLILVFCENKKKAVNAFISGIIVCAIIAGCICVSNFQIGSDSIMPNISVSSPNLALDAKIVFESLKENEKPDAENMLIENNDCWTAQAPDGLPAEGCDNANNSYAEIQLNQVSDINTAIIEEVGNEAQYFRLQAFVNNEWITVYRSEKIQSMRICSFDTVTTDKVRLSIDKFRDDSKPVRIKSIKLYNEPKREAKDFEVTAYQRLDGDVPTQILSKGEEYVNNYARFYDVYSTIIVFAAVHWDENGKMNFGDAGEEKFAAEISALKEIISHRSNKQHKVKLIVTALADGAWGNGHNGVNAYMADYWEDVANQIVNFIKKYDFDGVDIDWEYPACADDWKNYDSFIQKLYKDLNEYKEGTIISTALSSGQLGLSKETFDCIDQIQFMAYDGSDEDGYQSSLQQAQEGLKAFAENGADISKINIGIAAYGRPVNATPYWATWRDLKDANYWNNKYYTVEDANQIYEGTFCSPALAGDKTALALLSGAGGVMVFRVGCDKTMDDSNSVACGIENAINRYIENW